MTLRYLIVALVASAITIFALQNNEATAVQFLVWSFRMPLATVILTSVAAGIVLVGLPLWVGGWRLRARARSLESRLAAAEQDHRREQERRHDEDQRREQERRHDEDQRRDEERRRPTGTA